MLLGMLGPFARTAYPFTDQKKASDMRSGSACLPGGKWKVRSNTVEYVGNL